MGQFDFQSPGAAVTDALTKLVAQRKMEARQNMLDQLSAQAEDRAQQQAQDEHAWKQFQTSTQTQENERNRVTDLTSNWTVGADPEAYGVSPEDIALLKKHAKLKEMPPAPDLTGGQKTGNQAAKIKYSYVGSPAEQEKERRKIATGGVIATQIANAPDALTKAMWEREALRATLNDGTLDSKDLAAEPGFGPDTPTQIFDQGKGTFSAGPSMKPGTQVVTKPEKTPHEPPYIITNEGTPENPVTRYTNPDTHQSWTINGSKNPIKPVSNLENFGIGQPMQEGLAMAKSELDGALQPDDDGNMDTDNEVSINSYRNRSAGLIAGARNLTPNASSLLQLAIANPTAYEAKVREMAKSGQLTKADTDQINSLMPVVVPDKYKYVLSTHVFGKKR